MTQHKFGIKILPRYLLVIGAGYKVGVGRPTSSRPTRQRPRFWALASPWTPRRPKERARVYSSPMISPYSDCSLACFLHNSWHAGYPSVDYICEARCACSHLFAPFIWNQIVLLMLICAATLATVGGSCSHPGPSPAGTHARIVGTPSGAASPALTSAIVFQGVGVRVFNIFTASLL